MKKRIPPVAEVITQCWKNRYRLWSLAVYDVKVRNSGTWFGFLWNFINPILQILVYWFVFSIGLNSAAPKGEYSYLVWMVTGIMPWFYISEAMQSSTMAIYGFQDVLKRMRFPVAIVPIKTVLSALITHVMAMVIVVVLFFGNGHRAGIHFWEVFYYMAASFVFLSAFAMFASAITVMFKDFQKLLGSIIRLLFYISPVVWSPENLPEHLQFILSLNPLGYIINGYRESILYNTSFLEFPRAGLYFWGVTLVLLFVGCSVHVKFRKRFIDLV